MNAHNSPVSDFDVPAMQRSLREVVEEYDQKAERIPEELQRFKDAITALELSSCIEGVFGGSIWSNGRYGSAPSVREAIIQDALLKSAWQHVYRGLNVNRIASAKDRKRFEMSMENPPEFTMENIGATFEDYWINQRHHILKGLAECFCDLDPAYRSHTKVKIGVEGLPKRIIIQSTTSYGSWGWERTRDTLNALNVFRGKPHIEQQEYYELLDAAEEHGASYHDGIEIRRFQNGNAHLHFDPETLREINLALAEFYGDTLPDSPEAAQKPRPGTAVSKDLAYYPTPRPVIEEVMRRLYLDGDLTILEPSCGCGRIMDAIREKNPCARVTGVEYHGDRAMECRAKGHHVHKANFLETAANPIFDVVFMNPPFNGQHWRKHLDHARKFLKARRNGDETDGVLACILPASALYDGHLKDLGLTSPRDHGWYDLPVASFAESGTNIPTGFLIIGPD
ncbi:DUF4942 domain-containing protein [Tritonibacter scottomollicae]|uniref:Methyltransferase family protein n=1 Tax=Tritonibacter scottomollicae TaxID=483013 RepID=A0A2T1A5D4_TRISK|nr:DUF4942 domain-containing protein [Tritonibacter scottomollicae]PRZ43813.1 methyltransferase family protein [Tritonibacter scottomollicae]